MNIDQPEVSELVFLFVPTSPTKSLPNHLRFDQNALTFHFSQYISAPSVRK